MINAVCEEVRLLTTCRWRTCFMTLTGTTCLLAMRVNFGFAIVCMVMSDNSTEPLVQYNTSQLSPWAGNISLTEHSMVLENERKCGAHDQTGSTLVGQGGEFVWNKALQSKLLASFYYGYVVTQIPGGWLARKYGARRVIGYSFLFLIISTMLFPVGTRLHVYMAFALRVLAGLASGLVFPAMSCLWGRWAPPMERSKLYAVQTTGTPLGSVLTLSVSGYLCNNGFDNGWAAIFYVTGITGAIWVVFWFWIVSDTPQKHPTISDKERGYIESSIGDNNTTRSKDLSTPWRSILTSPAVWAGVVAHSGTNWTMATLLTGLPTYMKEVLAFDIQENGVLSAVPFICSASASPIIGCLADALQEKKLLNTRNTRRLFESISGVGTALFMILAGFVTCDNRVLSVVYLSVATTCLDVVKAGQGPNSLDIAPRFSGEIWGLSNTLATVPGMIAPIINGMLTPNGTQEEWQAVFYLCAGFSVSKTIFFFFFVRGHVLPWAANDVIIEHVIEKTPPPDDVKLYGGYGNHTIDITNHIEAVPDVKRY